MKHVARKVSKQDYKSTGEVLREWRDRRRSAVERDSVPSDTSLFSPNAEGFVEACTTAPSHAPSSALAEGEAGADDAEPALPEIGEPADGSGPLNA